MINFCCRLCSRWLTFSHFNFTRCYSFVAQEVYVPYALCDCNDLPASDSKDCVVMMTVKHFSEKTYTPVNVNLALQTVVSTTCWSCAISNFTCLSLLWRLQPDAVGGQRGPSCHFGGKSPNNGLICLLVSITLYSTLGYSSLLKIFSWLLWQDATQTMLANKDNSCSSLYVQLTVRMHLTIQ